MPESLTSASLKDVDDIMRVYSGVTKEKMISFAKDLIPDSEPEPEILITFRRPSDLVNLTLNPDDPLVGDGHIIRGEIFAIAGAPGVGKSRAAMALAEAGASQRDWFGFRVHRQFRTLIIQSENGPRRLRDELSEMNVAGMDEFVRICEPPPFGLVFSRADFRDQVNFACQDFLPDLVILDPWNSVVTDEKAKDYLEAFRTVRNTFRSLRVDPAIGIVCHTRKPKAEQREQGRNLLHTLVGSYALGSVPRAVFVMEHASPDPQDDRIVLTCAKNNNGELGKPSAWRRRIGRFEPVTDFDWGGFHNPVSSGRRQITPEVMAEVFHDGAAELTRSQAVDRLGDMGFRKSTAYEALNKKGRFARNLTVTKGGNLNWNSN